MSDIELNTLKNYLYSFAPKHTDEIPVMWKNPIDLPTADASAGLVITPRLQQ